MFIINGCVIIQEHFPDHTLNIRLPSLNSLTIEWYYENDSELFTLICIAKHYSNSKMQLYMPYCPHARMDRVYTDSDVFTLKYFAEIINSLNFETVTIRDPHSNVAPALLNNCEIQSASPYILEAISISQPDLAFYPDEGAMKRYAAHSHLPYTFGIKNRDWQTGIIQDYQIVNKDLVKDKDILIIDDICSRGDTFIFAAEALKEAGARSVSLYVTHLEETVAKGAIQTSGLIDKIYTTNSLKWDISKSLIPIQVIK